MTDDKDNVLQKTTTRPTTFGRRVPMIAAVLVGLALGAGATAIAQKGRAVTYVALSPAPISAMKPWSSVAVEGEIADVFGNKFVVQDRSGRALVETGRGGEGRELVVKNETVAVQGRFDRGFIHAISIRHSDGRTDTLDPPPLPPGPDRARRPVGE